MKKLKLALIIFISVCFVSFIPHSKISQKKTACPIYLYASNQASGSVKLYRVTYYAFGNNVSQVVNLSSGQSTLVSTYVDGINEISVQIKGGTFDHVTIEDMYGIPLYSLPYDGSLIYWFYNVQFTNCYTNTIVLY